MTEGTGPEGSRRCYHIVLTARRLPNGDAPPIWLSVASGSISYLVQDRKGICLVGYSYLRTKQEILAISEVVNQAEGFTCRRYLVINESLHKIRFTMLTIEFKMLCPYSTMFTVLIASPNCCLDGQGRG